MDRRESVTPIELKDIKRGDIFYERGSMDWYSLSALEDSHYKGDIEIMGKSYKQYQVKVKTEFNEELYVLVTEGLPHYSGKYFK